MTGLVSVTDQHLMGSLVQNLNFPGQQITAPPPECQTQQVKVIPTSWTSSKLPGESGFLVLKYILRITALLVFVWGEHVFVLLVALQTQTIQSMETLVGKQPGFKISAFLEFLCHKHMIKHVHACVHARAHTHTQRHAYFKLLDIYVLNCPPDQTATVYQVTQHTPLELITQMALYFLDMNTCCVSTNLTVHQQQQLSPPQRNPMVRSSPSAPRYTTASAA